MASAGSHPRPDDKEWRESVRSAWIARRRSGSSLNITGTVDDIDDDARFRRCWGRSDCRTCLGFTACIWCPFVRCTGHICIFSSHIYSLYLYTANISERDLCAQRLPHPGAGSCLGGRSRLPLLGRAMGAAHTATRLPGVDDYKSDGTGRRL